MIQDPYQTLGVSKTATQDEIKNAYRRQAKKHHPDLNPGSKQSEAKFKEISAAYERIGDPASRAQFDRGETAEQMADSQARAHRERPSYQRTQQRPGQDARYSTNFGQGFGTGSPDDFFENLFRQSGAGPRTPSPESYQMEVGFKDSILGADREVTLPDGRKISVKIPPGVESGQRLRIQRPEQKGGPILVEIRVQPDALFTREGSNVEVEVPISFFEGLLGAEIRVPTLDGLVALKVPAGVTTGSRLRIKGKGVRSRTAGDQIVKLRVELPKQVGADLASSLEKLRERHAYDPRSS